MKHKLFTWLLVAICLAGATTAHATVYSGTCGKYLDWSLDTETEILTITGYGQMGDYFVYKSDTRQAAPWYQYRSNIKEVLLPSGLTDIAGYAFYGCYNLSTISIPETVTRLGYYAFYNCTNLADIHIPKSVTAVGGYTFYNTLYYNSSKNWKDNKLYIDDCLITANTSISGIDTISPNTRLIAKLAYKDCKKLTGIVIPSQVEHVGIDVFSGCSGLTTVYWDVENAGDYGNQTSPIYNLSSITSITFGNHVKHIPSYFCDRLSGLTNVVLGDSIESIGAYAFEHCIRLTQITLPESLKTIGSYAFYYCIKLTNITIPQNVEKMGYCFIYGCENLKTVVWNARAAEITSSSNSYHFYNTPVENIEFGNTVEKIPEYLCYSITALTNITIPEGVKEIGGSAFANCTGISQITIPSTVTTIGRAFYGCSNLKKVYNYSPIYLIKGSSENGYLAYYADEVYNYGPFTGSCGDKMTWTFNEADSTLTLAGTGEMTKLSSYNAYPWYPLRSVLRRLVIGEGITSIASNAFDNSDYKGITTVYNYSSLLLQKGSSDNGYAARYATEVHNLGTYSGTCGDNLKWTYKTGALTISGTGAMSDYSSSSNTPWTQFLEDIQSLKIEDGVTTIGNYAFAQLSNLKELQLSKQLTTIGNYAFQGDKQLTSLTLPSKMTTLGYNSFRNCTGLQTLKLSDAITTIGSSAFENDSLIAELTLPKTLTEIGSSAFYRCYGLKTIYNNSSLLILKGSSDNGYVGRYAENVYMTTTYSGTCDDNLQWTLTPDGILTISGTGEMTDYSSSSAPWNKYSSLVKKVIIEEGVTSIGVYAFRNFTVSEIQLPTTLTKIGSYAFSTVNVIYNYSQLLLTKGKSGYGGIASNATEVYNLGTWQGNCTETIQWKLNKGILTISGTGNMPVYSSKSMAPWHDYISVVDTTYINGVNSVDLTYDFVNVIIVGADVKNVNVSNNSNQTVIYRSTKTLVSTVSSVGPAGKGFMYDIDGDGQMEFVDISRNYGVWYTRTYSPTGKLQDTLALFTDLNENANIGVIHSNNDGKIDITKKYRTWGGADGRTSIPHFEILESSIDSFTNISLDLYNTFPLDANFNGRTDFYSYDVNKHYIHYRQADGSYLKTELKILTDTAEVDSALYQDWSRYSNYNGAFMWSSIPSLSDGWMVKAPRRRPADAADTADDEPSSQPLMMRRVVAATSSSADNFKTIDTAIDLDRDGRVDLMSSTTGAVLYNLGDNRFIMGQFPGKVIAKDLNGDGVLDYVVYNEETKVVYLQIYEGNGSYRTQTLFQNQMITDVWCYDFDNDGDMDILLPFDYTQSGGYAFLVFFRNDGNNTFKKIENAFDEPVMHFKFVDCRDIDNDGKYEIIAADSIKGTTGNYDNYLYKGDYYIIRYDNKFKVTYDNAPFIQNSIKDTYGTTAYNTPLIGDFNSDGILDFWCRETFRSGSSSSSQYILSHFTPSKPNTAPKKMKKPSFVLDAERQMINISWERGSDSECSDLDLTYSLRIGSKSGEGDMWLATANPDGTQRSLAEGNVGAYLNQWVNVADWANGDYYIAVQAIDPSGLGSAWSDELVYHHTILSANFVIDAPELTTADTLTVRYTGTVNPAYTYNWNFGDSATVLTKDTEQQLYTIAYNTSGTKTISLQVANADGVTSPLKQLTVKVSAIRFDQSANVTLSYLDIDADGVIDGIGYVGGSDGLQGIFQNRGDGTFKKVAKTYNTDLKIGYPNPNATTKDYVSYNSIPCFVDIDMNGYPDIATRTSKGNLIYTKGSLDLDFFSVKYQIMQDSIFYLTPKLEEVFDEGNFRYITWRDMNNDGLMDIIGTITTTGLSKSGLWYGQNNSIYSGAFINYKRGLVETSITRSYSGYSGTYYIDKRNVYTVPGRVADFNNDGLLDRFRKLPTIGEEGYETDPYVYTIDLYRGENTYERQQPLTSVDGKTTIDGIADMNNDGYPDLLIIKNEKVLLIVLGDENMSYTETREIFMPGDYILPTNNSSYSTITSLDRDFDNNGYIDLVMGNGVLIYFYSNFEISCQSLPVSSLATYPFIDLNGDGVPDLNGYTLHSRITNTPPSVPQNIRAVQTDEGILLQWDAAQDRETPPAQMRYNISLKKKNASVGSTGAFIISPMNGLSNEAAVVPDYPYHKGTQMLVPIRRFEVGQEYEFQIQAIDLWSAHSDMSAPYTFKVEKQVSITMPEKACIDAPVTIAYRGTEKGTCRWDFGGGKIMSGSGNGPYEVQWSSMGVKNVSVTINGTTTTRPIYVQESPDLSFTLPEYVFAGVWNEFTLPEAIMNPSLNIGMRTSANIADKSGSGEHTIGHIMREEGSLRAKVRFSYSDSNAAGGTEPGWIEFFIVDKECGEISYRATTTILGNAPNPAISIVTVDGATGKNKIIWDAPSDLPDYINLISIYKEEGSTNNFVKQAEISVSAGQWIDLGSDPRVRKNRYRITYSTSSGAESNPSAVHSSTHLQLNRGLNNSVNLVWTKYEGGTIDNYRILRGTNANNLTVIATVPGTENTYTDLNAPENAYYALEYDNLYFDKWVWMSGVARAPKHAPSRLVAAAPQRKGQSNIMASAESSTVTFAEKLTIRSMERSAALTATQTQLHLYVEVLPAMATYKRASWKIMSGADLATIDDNGLLTANTEGKNGTVLVRATALDGSGIYAEKSIPVSGMTKNILVESVRVQSISGGNYFYSTNKTIVLKATVLPANADNGNVSWSILQGKDKINIQPNGLQCTVTVNSGAEDGDVMICATATDASGKYGFITLTIDENLAPKSYTIRFVNEDGTLLQESTELEDTTPAYNQATPQKAATAQYTYTFSGWSPEIAVVTGNATYTATFTESLRKYTVTFVGDGGAVLQTSEVEYGTMPTYNGHTPTKPATAQYTYTFSGWSNEIVAVTGDVTYTATFTSVVNEYTITFVDENSTVLEQKQWQYGSTPAYSGDTPTKAADAQYTYTFAGWSPTITTVTGDATYKAAFTSTLNEYTITFLNDDGTVLDSRLWKYGDMPTCTEPEKPATADSTFVFAGWTPEVVAVTGEATYTATYTARGNAFTITFVDWDNTVLCEGQWLYGFMPSCNEPTREDDDTYTYTFAGWTPEVVEVTEDATYTATYTATEKGVDVENIEGSKFNVQGSTVQKVIENGHVYILMPDGRKYTVTGAEVK